MLTHFIPHMVGPAGILTRFNQYVLQLHHDQTIVEGYDHKERSRPSFYNVDVCHQNAEHFCMNVNIFPLSLCM